MRLTIGNNGVYDYTTNELELVKKLGQLEDLMEKYHCETIDELDFKLKTFDYLFVHKDLYDKFTKEHPEYVAKLYDYPRDSKGRFVKRS